MDKLIFRVNKGRTDQTNMLRVYSSAYDIVKNISEKTGQSKTAISSAKILFAEMVITGERRDEGGMRSVPRSEQWNANNTMCFAETADGKYRFRPLYYVSDEDKAWYKEHYKIRYSDAYEVYGLKRTGCCGCPISSRAVDDLEKIRPFEPNVVKAAWNIFGDSYRYRQGYNEFKAKKRAEEKENKKQMSLFDLKGGE